MSILDHTSRGSILKGRDTGRLISTAVILAAVTATGAFAVLPVFGYWSAVTIGLSVLVSNLAGSAMDMGDPQATDGKTSETYKQGFIYGLVHPFKWLPLSVLAAPVMVPLLLVATALDKETKGRKYYIFPEGFFSSEKYESSPCSVTGVLRESAFVAGKKLSDIFKGAVKPGRSNPGGSAKPTLPPPRP